MPDNTRDDELSYEERVEQASRVAKTLSEKWKRAHQEEGGEYEQSGQLLRLIARPFRDFFSISASGGIMLLLATVAALAWANSPWHETYHHFWESTFRLSYGIWSWEQSLHFLVNDVLMVIFFFSVGLEIKREIIAGELSNIKQASLPIFAALGGMLIPAGMYLLLHGGQPGVEGWGVPMATDIAFSLGILQLLGKRVPVSMKVFLTAFAIVDDLGAILIIALFYSESFDLQALSIAGGLIGILVLMNRYNVRSIWLYGLIGIGIWTQFYLAGIHPTVAGVLVALTIPANPKINLRGFSKKLTAGLFEFSRLPEAGSMIVLTKPQIKSIDYMREAIDRVQSPVQRLENTLHNFVLYVIMPVFALANAGVTLTEGGAALFTGAVTLHVGISLLFGKLLGITAFSWAAVRSKLARLPAGTNWHHIIGLSLLGGIGFTMSLFISGLAFAEEHSLNQAKVGILIGSFLAGTAGLFWLNKHIPHLKASASESPQLRSKSMMDEY